ncbi:MAG: FtsW/RodA/SpoVE family cell cycle protein, partial [Fidelibacterota bacterium]
LFPVTGLPMPFISYGGTSMLFTGFMVGLLLNISKHTISLTISPRSTGKYCPCRPRRSPRSVKNLPHHPSPEVRQSPCP